MRPLALLALGALLVPAATPAASAQDAEDRPQFRAARGRTTYRLYCRNCHGKDGQGDGPIAELLKVQPADLTALAEKAGGELRAESVYQTIDGRNDIAAHGSREMPVWGFSFQDPSRSEDQEDEVRERILDLVEFIRTLQPASSTTAE
jgi:mono/diheme cytochrome c family protein